MGRRGSRTDQLCNVVKDIPESLTGVETAPLRTDITHRKAVIENDGVVDSTQRVEDDHDARHLCNTSVSEAGAGEEVLASRADSREVLAETKYERRRRVEHGWGDDTVLCTRGKAENTKSVND